MKKILIIGASRGIGAALVEHFSATGHHVIGVSRSPAANCDWLQADISTQEGVQKVVEHVANACIDTFIFSSGIWEKHGFTEHFDFSKTSAEETQEIMQVNAIAPIEMSKGLAKNLALSENPRAVYLGALSGVDQIASDQVAYAASKFALRGAIQSLRKAFRSTGIGFTVINPGNVGTEEVLQDIEAGHFTQQEPIPIADIIASIEMLMALSKHTEIGDINMMQK